MGLRTVLGETIAVADAEAVGVPPAWLKKSDVNADGVVSADEVEFPARVVLPVTKDAYVIAGGDDFRVYAGIVGSATVIRDKILPSAAVRCHDRGIESPYHTETWIARDKDKLLNAAPLAGETTFGLKVLDAASDTVGTHYLIRDASGHGGNYGDYFFTLHDYGGDEFFLELNGCPLDLHSDVREPPYGDWRAEILKGLFALFIVPPKGFEASGARVRDRAEGLMLGVNPEFFAGAPANPGPKRGEISAELAARKSAVEKGESPMVSPPLTTVFGGVDRLWDVRAASPLSEAERKNLATAFAAVPGEMLAALSAAGQWDGLSFEVMADDLVAVWNPSGWGGLYDSSRNRIFLRRAAVNGPDLRSILIHELAHRFELTYVGHPDSAAGITAYHRRVAKRAGMARINPAVSPYALKNPTEFIAECIVAYFNGEEDASPIRGTAYGPRSRAELREKHPDLYLAIADFFTPGTEKFANATCFSK